MIAQLIAALVANPDLRQEVRGRFDLDGDGVTAADDCDDRDPEVYYTDFWAVDSDGDGYDDQNSVVFACSQPSPAHRLVVDASDCDDRDPTINPGAVDEPFDGIDQNCDTVLACEFPVEQSDGSFVTMANEVRLSLNALSPDGQMPIEQDGQGVVWYNLTAVHPECPAVGWTAGAYDFNYTDNTQSGWQPHDITVADLSIGWYAVVAGPVQLDANDLASVIATNVEIPGGTTHIFEVAANLTGASTSADDSVRVDIDGATFTWCTLGSCSDINDTRNGGTLVF